MNILADPSARFFSFQNLWLRWLWLSLDVLQGQPLFRRIKQLRCMVSMFDNLTKKIGSIKLIFKSGWAVQETLDSFID